MSNPPVSKESSVSSDFSDIVQHKNKRNAFKNGAAAILYASNGKAIPVSASPNEPANGSDQEMPLLMYQTWFDAIEKDDLESAKRILTGVRTEVDIMLNGKFEFHYFTNSSKNKIWKQKNKTLPCFFQRPVVLAAVFRSKEVLKFILNQGADIYLNDGGDNNIIHAIVWGAALQPEYENEYKKIYRMITDSLSRQEQKSLLMRENADGLRPLELAARLTTFYLFIAIFNTEGVYVHNKGRLGAYVCKWYDVTDYESIDSKSRRNRSPLRIFTFIEKERLQNASTREIMLNNKAISKWIDIKIQSNTLHLIFWFLARVSYTMLFLVYANSNYEESDSRSAMRSVSTLSSSSIMLNMLELTDLKIDNLTDVAILHVAYVIIVPILLVNFLIALMSNSVSEVAENRYLIMALQRLNAALQVESRFGMHISVLYKSIQDKLLVTAEGRVYVECFALKEDEQ
ncbi:DgyrCDS13692 [Dimorphilus gyrociliatus]|uniref:DgyrCDS13692 n=1 Tax=Dimorphilus gyrociliatus TaxID=2664684 RepID=A0A7I8WBF7_9ANNE|nr:DgyrCDS13692 [Dimorphilus gyrociliatus]